MVGLTNIQLEKLGKKILGSSFLGVYPSDSMPKITNIKNNSIIFNLSKHTEPGTHYVAVFLNNNAIFYFDSYGKPLTNPHIKKNLRKINIPIFYQKRSIQHKDSIFCGLYALAYLKSTQKKQKPPNHFYSMFLNPPKKQNDKIVTDYLLMK
jgi:hypothetical protein